MKFFYPFLCVFTVFCSTQAQQTVTILGAGYVGLVTGVCLAELHKNENIKVVCTDIDATKINGLCNRIIPIYEPGLKELVSQNMQRNTLFFSNNISKAIQMADIIFIAVGTPTQKNGETNLIYLENALKVVAESITTTPKTIIVKSTVPIGTCRKASTIFDAHHIPASLYRIIFNPEFLREGSAIYDFLHPDRIVIGVTSPCDEEIIKELYQPLLNSNVPLMVTDFETAETIKYASNSFLALKLSFINEMANLCEATGANITTASRALGLDHRIGPSFLNPGPGYGGSCLPKDTKALLTTAKKLGIPLRTVNAAIKANKYQKTIPFKKLQEAFNNNLSDKTVTILGLAFKANTDDIRYSPAIPLIKKLLLRGVRIKVYDPAAMDNMKKRFSSIIYCESIQEAIEESDAVIILTDWNEFKNLPFLNQNDRCTKKIIIDPRNLLKTRV